jgi:ADP-heptose:LPS heptosyltransferase
VFAALWPLRITAYKLAKIRRRKVERATGGRRLSQTELKSLQKILCLRLDHIGDLMMTFPAIAALRALYPNARIDLVTQTANRPLLSCVDYIDNVFYYNAPFFHRSSSRPSSFFEWLKLAIEIRRRRYDIAFDFRGDSDARKLAFASGAKFRLGQHPSPLHLDEPGNWAFALTHSCNPHPDTHMSDSCLDLLTNAGIDVSWPESYFAVCNDHVSKAAAYLTGSQIIGPYAVVHMLSVEEIRNWIPQRMVDVINHLTMAHGLSVILTGAEGQREQIQSVMNIVNNKESVRNAAGELTLDMLPAILAQARIMVTIDTGPMHIAAALKVPVVALMLPINARLHFPHGQRERIVVAGTAPVDLVRSDKNALLPLASVSSGDVIRAVDEVLLSISSHLGAEPPSIQWPQTKAHDIINRK